MFKKILLNPWTALLTLALVLAIRMLDPAFVESVRLRSFDQLITGQPEKALPVHVVNIDEAALDKLGQFPFPRDMYADIIQDLYKRNAGLVVFNVLMPEGDRFRKDAVLAKTLEQMPVILPHAAAVRGKNNAFANPVQTVGTDPRGLLVEYPGIIANIPVLEDRAAGTGIVNTFPEVDGVVRRMPLLITTGDGALHSALSLETLRVAGGDARIQAKFSELGIEALRVPSQGKIVTDRIGRIWIDYSVRPHQHSLVNLPADFGGGIVVVGLGAAGLVNPVPTSRGEVWPQELQASVIGTMLNKTTIVRHNLADETEILAILVAGVVLIFLMRWTYAGIVATVVVVGSAVVFSQLVYTHHMYLWDSTAPVVGLVLVALHAYMTKFVSEFLQKQQIRKQFATYMSPDLVAKLVKDPGLLKLGGSEQELTIGFTDVRGFTSISEHYGKNVEGLTSIMNRYMTAMCKSILTNGGTLDKFIGDAIMFFFNAPVDNTKHCKDAVKAALEMLGDLERFNNEITSEGVPPFGMGIGINTGVVVVGNMGSEQRFDYTCLGDAVNLASRLEGQSKNYGVLIVLGPVTAERVASEYFTLELDCIAVKGKQEGVNIYTVFYNPEPEVDKVKWAVAREHHDLMLQCYREQKWATAEKLVNDLRGEFNGQMDHYYDIWLERIEEMRNANLPPDWDGVFRAQSK